jgi:hypothetical protein
MHEPTGAHARHDRHLVAALAADDLEPIVRTEAETMVASCRDCAELFADLKLIAVATAALPEIPRTRDFRISAADAARLQPRGWRALLAAIGGARATFSRPLAAGLTTLGLVGLLATTIPGALHGQSLGAAGAAPVPAPVAGAPAGGYSYASAAPASLALGLGAPVDSATGAAPAAAASSAPSAAATSLAQVKTDTPQAAPSKDSVQAVATAAPGAGGLNAVPAPGTKGGRGTGVGATESGAATTDQSTGDQLLSASTGSGGPSPLLPISIVCLVAGLGLFAARWGARRLARR